VMAPHTSKSLSAVSAVLASCLLAVPPCWGEPEAPDLFQRVFSTSRDLDAKIVEEVKQLPPGERLTIDTDQDGEADEQWYLDTSRRHTINPIIVRVVDEDGDLHQDGRGDLDSDLYFWDWQADGKVDVVTDYQDNDGDNDVDEMGVFFDRDRKDDKSPLAVWWGVDVGDDNLLWYDVNGTYYQRLCQYRSHFSGDEVFYQFELSDDTTEWLNMWEDPFAFYDPDGDTCSEVVVRIDAMGDKVNNLRYSIDADDDAHGRRTHDYDFSVTAIAPEGTLSPTAAHTAPRHIRGIQTHPVITWESAKAFSQNAPWAKAMLTWDEINSNTDADAQRDPNERWEGLLNAPSKSGSFPQVGGPATSNVNKRVEVAQSPPHPLRLYFDTADRRLHLIGADEGYLDVDFDMDGTVDAAYTYVDDNDDGIFDRRLFDADGDGRTDSEWPLAGNCREFPLEFEELSPFYKTLLTETLEESRAFVDVAIEAWGQWPVSAAEVADFFKTGLADYIPERQVGRRIRETPAGARYYLDLIRDRLFVSLQQRLGSHGRWTEVAEAYGQGAYKRAARRLAGIAGLPWPPVSEPRPLRVQGRTYRKRIPVHVRNVDDWHHDAFPVVVSLSELRRVAPDFNPENCAVVMGDYWVDWVEIPHQMDTWSWSAEQELSFLASLRPGEGRTFYVYFDPKGQRQTQFPQVTRAVLDHPAYVAWESEFGAFRFYTGQFDFFGKQVDRRLPKPERLIYPLIDENYHEEQDWGIDALHVGETSGLGGLTLYTDKGPYLVQSPAGEGHVAFEHRVLGAGPVRAAVEITATNVWPDEPDRPVRLRCLVYAEHQESEIRVRVPEGVENARLAPGLLKLPQESWFLDEERGVLGTWGYQGDDIGHIGLGVIVPPAQAVEILELPEERRIKCSLEKGELRYWILGEWRRGMQYPVAPTLDNWRRVLAQLADRLHNPPETTLGELETASE